MKRLPYIVKEISQTHLSAGVMTEELQSGRNYWRFAYTFHFSDSTILPITREYERLQDAAYLWNLAEESAAPVARISHRVYVDCDDVERPQGAGATVTK